MKERVIDFQRAIGAHHEAAEVPHRASADISPAFLPASAAAKNPQNPFQHTTVVDPRTTALAVFAWLGEQERDFLPLRFARQRPRPCYRPLPGAADFAYRSFQKPQPP